MAASWCVPATRGSRSTYCGDYKSKIVYEINFNEETPVRQEAKFTLPSTKTWHICRYWHNIICIDDHKVKYLDTDWNWKDLTYKDNRPIHCIQLYVHDNRLYIITAKELIHGNIDFKSNTFCIYRKIPLSMITMDYWLFYLKNDRVNPEHIKKDLDERMSFLREDINDEHYAYGKTILLDELDKTKRKEFPLPYFLRDV